MTGYKHEGRAKEAEVLLRKMIQLENAGHRRCAPDMISYSVCMDAVSSELNFLLALASFR